MTVAITLTFDDAKLDALGVSARPPRHFRDENRRMARLLRCLAADIDPSDRKDLLHIVLPAAERPKHDLRKLVAVPLGHAPTADGALAYLDEPDAGSGDVRVVLESKQGAAINFTGAFHTRTRPRFPGRYVSTAAYPDPGPAANDGWHDGAASGWTCCSPGHTQSRRGGEVRCGLPQGDFYRVWNWLPPSLQMNNPDSATWLVLHEDSRQSPFAKLATGKEWTERRWSDVGNGASNLLRARLVVPPIAASGAHLRFIGRVGSLLRTMLDPYGPGRPARLPGEAWVGMRTGLNRLWNREGPHLEHRDRKSVVIVNAQGEFEIVGGPAGPADPNEAASWHADILDAGCRLSGDPCIYPMCAGPKGPSGDCGHVDDDGYRGPGTTPAP